ncbi:myelin-oligodendrocyte glycoprotein-like [Neolamprologus brichardi]|uniref:myelin-oligodendrocyte glycoprotein-like n=1 Tax=Neolamprologus brichardi TaxID=32507 RepID=UPI001643F63D|nr:myelin-oligodendrocyte glycoprotein-like [Neolamprologus brichardi]
MSRIMAGIKCVVFLMVLILQWTHARGDAEVFCIFMESCMLPCSYSGSDVVINWFQVSAGDLNVHSFYNNKDQLKLQSERFRGRTSLFNDQISAGIASLQLTKVEVQDEGRYKCYTSTDRGNQESFINLKIKEMQVWNLQEKQTQDGKTLNTRIMTAPSPQRSLPAYRADCEPRSFPRRHWTRGDKFDLQDTKWDGCALIVVA